MPLWARIFGLSKASSSFDRLPERSQQSQGSLISNTDAWPRMFSVCPSWQNCSYKTRSDTAVDVKQNGAHKVQKLILWWWKRKVKQLHSTRRFSVHPIHRMRIAHGEYKHLLPELFEDPQKFVDYHQMQPTTFHDLLTSVICDINKSSRPDSNNQLFVILFFFFQRELVMVLKHEENYVPWHAQTEKIVHAWFKIYRAVSDRVWYECL